MHVIATSLLTVVCAAAVYSDTPLAGTWKQNRAKTQFDSDAVTTIDSWNNGIRYSVPTGPVYGGTLDDTERPGLGSYAKDTFRIKKVGDRGFEATQSRNGKVVIREQVEVSADGKTLTRRMTNYNRKDGGSTTNVFVHKRTAGDGKPYPFLGTWTQDRSLTKWGSDAIPFNIAQTGNVLTWTDPVTDNRMVVDLGKSTVDVTGTNTAPDVKRSVRKVDDRSMELTTSRGATTSKALYTVSPDGKTMTVKVTTNRADGKPMTSSFFYDRQ